jgi:hypothetical protein
LSVFNVTENRSQGHYVGHEQINVSIKSFLLSIAWILLTYHLTKGFLHFVVKDNKRSVFGYILSLSGVLILKVLDISKLTLF